MALIDDINALPTTVGDGNTGHLNNHQVIHAALKDHESRFGARDIVGTGSPEGKIIATVGTTYSDSAATNGAVRWIKAVGAGSTGWRVEYGDTGWRDISSLLEPGLITINTGGHFRVRRIGPYVEYSIKDFTFHELGNLWALPSGFGAEYGRDGQTALPDGGTLHVTPYWVRVENFTAGASVAVYRAATVRFIATPEWPSILPGTPA